MYLVSKAKDGISASETASMQAPTLPSPNLPKRPVAPQSTSTYSSSQRTGRTCSIPLQAGSVLGISEFGLGGDDHRVRCRRASSSHLEPDCRGQVECRCRSEAQPISQRDPRFRSTGTGEAVRRFVCHLSEALRCIDACHAVGRHQQEFVEERLAR